MCGRGEPGQSSQPFHNPPSTLTHRSATLASTGMATVLTKRGSAGRERRFVGALMLRLTICSSKPLSSSTPAGSTLTTLKIGGWDSRFPKQIRSASGPVRARATAPTTTLRPRISTLPLSDSPHEARPRRNRQATDTLPPSNANGPAAFGCRERVQRRTRNWPQAPSSDVHCRHSG